MALQTLTSSFLGRISNYLGTPLLLALLTIASVVEIYTGIDLYSHLENSGAARTDSRVYLVSQTEVDHTNLLLALRNLRMLQGAAGGTVAPSEDHEPLVAEVSQAFDVFYSRLQVIGTFLDLSDVPQDMHNRLTELSQTRDRLAEMFDQSDLHDPAQLQAVEDVVTAMDVPVRSMVLDALSYFVADTAHAREQIAAAMPRFVCTSLVALVVMGAAIWISMLLHRHLARQVSVIAAQKTKIQMVYDATLIAVVVTDLNGDLQLMNSAAEQMFGFKDADVKGRDVADFMIPHHRLGQYRQVLKRHREAEMGSIVYNGSVRSTLLRHDGTEFPVDLSIRSATDDHGDGVLISFVRDISEQITYETTLRDARDEAQRHAKAKTMFLATMSHEMRTPLHGLLAALDLIETSELDSQIQGLVKTARTCGMQTLNQINGVLELTRDGEIKEPLVPFCPTTVVSNILKELRPLAQDHGNQLAMTVTGNDSDAKWQGQPQAFMQVLYNLVGNALKFTQDGKVKVSLCFDARPAATAKLLVSVMDNGKGISREDQDRIFDLFYSGGSGSEGNTLESSGLGLALAKAAVHRMGGSINVESQLGVGSTFSFAIPLVALKDSQNPTLQLVDTDFPLAHGLRCLVVDDNRVNLELTAQMLRRLGSEVATCDNGEAVVAIVAAQVFDIVFMDLNMPGGMSGVETTHMIREQEITLASPTPLVIVALTADTTVTTSDMLQERLDGILYKPVQMQELREALGRFLPRGKAATQSADPATAAKRDPCPDAFSELFDLIDHEHAKRLLIGVLADIDAALGAIRSQDADTADLLHRAIGSTAAVGLLELSKQLRHAENLARTGAWSALSAGVIVKSGV